MGNLSGAPSKLLMELAPGTTVLHVTLSRLVEADCFHGIVIATQKELFAPLGELSRRVREQGTEFGLSSPVPAIELVAGGETRQQSVRNALASIGSQARTVLVHDGARPFCPVAVIRSVAEAAERTGAAIAAVPVKPSLKRGNESGYIEATIPRAGVWEAQTPQGFSYSVLVDAYDKAERDGYSATDDSELVERLGTRVTLIPGDDGNLKITTEQDLLVARLRHSSR